MNELNQVELTEIKNRLFGQYCINSPSLGPFECFRMAPGILAVPNLPEWVQNMFRTQQIGFFDKKTPQTVNRYWMRSGGSQPLVLQQGDWFVKVCNEPLEINRYTPEAFNLKYGAKEIIAPEGIEAPMERTVEVYAPTHDEIVLAGEIETYLEVSCAAGVSKAYYHYLEVAKDMLRTGPLKNRMEPIRKYLSKLAEKGGQVYQSKYYKFLSTAVELLDGEE